MPYLVNARRAPGHEPVERRREDRRRSNCRGVIPDADLAVISHAAVTHRLAQVGIDADAEPLLERRKRG